MCAGASVRIAADCEALRQLAAMPQGERQVLLASVDLFCNRESSVSREARERLLRLLDLYGISFAIHMLVQKPTLATGGTAPPQVTGVWDGVVRATITEGMGSGDTRIEKQEWHLTQ